MLTGNERERAEAPSEAIRQIAPPAPEQKVDKNPEIKAPEVWKMFHTYTQSTFATIMLGKSKSKIRAFKLFKTSVNQDPDDELSIWQYLTGTEGVVALEGVLGIAEPGYHPKMARMEVYSYGSLEGWLKNRKEPTPILQILVWATHLGETLQRVHAKHVCHNDLAARNLLLEDDDSGALSIYLADFGLARYLPPPEPGSSPEAFEKYKTEELKKFLIDLACFGRVLLQLLAHDLSLKHPNLLNYKQHNTSKRFPWLYDFALNLYTNPSSITIQTAVESLQKTSEAFKKPASVSALLPEETKISKIEEVSATFFDRLKSDGFLFAKMSAEDDDNVKKLVLEATKALLAAEIDPLSDDACLDAMHVMKCIYSHSGWQNKFTCDHIKILTKLVKGKRERLTAFNLIGMFVWLGNPELKADQAIPADLAIEFIDMCLTKNHHIRSHFHGLISQKQADESKEKDSIFRLNDGFCINKSGTSLFRNLLLSNNICGSEYRHRLLFKYDLVNNRIIEATPQDRNFYQNSGVHLSPVIKGDEKKENVLAAVPALVSAPVPASAPASVDIAMPAYNHLKLATQNKLRRRNASTLFSSVQPDNTHHEDPSRRNVMKSKPY